MWCLHRSADLIFLSLACHVITVLSEIGGYRIPKMDRFTKELRLRTEEPGHQLLLLSPRRFKTRTVRDALSFATAYPLK